MRWLSLSEVLILHRRLIEQSGGTTGLRDLGLLEASLAQPRQSFAGIDLYPELSDKAACLGYSLIQNHPFIDGNKRVGHAAMEPHWSSMGTSWMPTWTRLRRRFSMLPAADGDVKRFRPGSASTCSRWI
jgi:prophage maintenance system killer protein